MSIKLMNRSAKLFTLLFILGVTVSGCYPPTAGPSSVLTSTSATGTDSSTTVVPSDVPTLTPATGPYWPTEAWRTSTPEEQGMDSQKLAEMVATIKERNMNVHSLLVIRNGYLVSETYFEPWQADSRHVIYSATKSFVSTLVGIALDKGAIDGVDHRVMDYFPERTIANLDQLKKDLTLEDLLTMRSGLEWTDPGTYYEMTGSPDWVQFVLDKPMVEPPGQRWHYCSGCSHLLNAIIQQTTGMKTRDFAEQNLFKPLGITDVMWPADNAGIPAGGAGMQLTPRDMAKLGYLYLRNGQWDGQQIVSSKWVENATRKYADVDIDPHFGYGYHWFTVNSMAGYAALGDHGQIILVIPEHDLVIVTTADTQESIFQLIEQYVLPAVQKAQ
jgi:CubicO group peptidase (beta-lactamase class C family)